MNSLPEHEALLDGIVRATQRSKKSSNSRLALTPPQLNIKQQRYPVLPTIRSVSSCSNEEVKIDNERQPTTQHCPTPLPPIQQSQNVYSLPMATTENLLSGPVPVLPLALPWQHLPYLYGNPFDAHHNTSGGSGHNINSKRVKKKELWFKKFKYRPMSENSAAVIIQKHCRGYLTRRNLEFQQYLANRWLASRLVDMIVDEVIRNDMLPDILIELLQERVAYSGWFGSDPEHQAHLLVCSQLIGEALSELLPVYVKEANHELVMGYLHEHAAHREPLVHVVKLLVDEVVNELVRAEVEQYVSDTLQSYLNESHAVQLADTLLEEVVNTDCLSELAAGAILEYNCDTLCDEVFEQELVAIIRECLLEEWAGGVWVEGSTLASSVVDHMMLQLLLSHVANQASILDVQHYSDSVLSELMLRVSLSQMMNIHERLVSTENSVVLRQAHQQLFQEMAFDTLLQAWKDLWS